MYEYMLIGVCVCARLSFRYVFVCFFSLSFQKCRWPYIFNDVFLSDSCVIKVPSVPFQCTHPVYIPTVENIPLTSDCQELWGACCCGRSKKRKREQRLSRKTWRNKAVSCLRRFTLKIINLSSQGVLLWPDLSPEDRVRVKTEPFKFSKVIEFCKSSFFFYSDKYCPTSLQQLKNIYRRHDRQQYIDDLHQ